MLTLIIQTYECSGVFLGDSGLDAIARLVDSYANINYMSA